MADIQSALTQALAGWDDEQPTSQAPATAVAPVKDYGKLSASEATFEVIKDCPGITHSGAVLILESYKHKQSSTSSLIYAMLRQGMVKLVEGTLHVCQNKYTPLKSSTQAKPKSKPTGVKEKAVAVNGRDQGIAALPAQATLTIEKIPATQFVLPVLDLDKFVAGLNIKQFIQLRNICNDFWQNNR